MAMAAGLDLAIINPNTPDMMGAVRAFRVLTGQDDKSTEYIRAYADLQIQTTQTAKTAVSASTARPEGEHHSLTDAVRRGLKTEARAAAEEALTRMEPLDLVNQVLIPALDQVGDGFEKGTIFLPQLLQSASAAQAAFDVVKAAIAASGTQGESRGRIVHCHRQGRCARYRQEYCAGHPGKLWI